MFFRAKDGRSYPLQRIRAIHPPRGDAVLVALDGGEVVEAAAAEIAELALRPVGAFAAQPQTYVVRVDDAAEDEVGKIAVIGWTVGADGRAWPVTVNGVNDGAREPLSVMTPDGQVMRPDAELWDSIDACVASLRAALAAA